MLFSETLDNFQSSLIVKHSVTITINKAIVKVMIHAGNGMERNKPGSEDLSLIICCKTELMNRSPCLPVYGEQSVTGSGTD